MTRDKKSDAGSSSSSLKRKERSNNTGQENKKLKPDSDVADGSQRKTAKEPESPQILIDYAKQCLKALEEEETDIASNDPLEDLNAVKSLCKKLEGNITKVKLMKESTGFCDELESMKRCVLMDIAHLKRLNRIDKFRFKKARDDVVAVRQRVDNHKLQLDNMQYEATYLQREADKCLRFVSSDEDIVLIPLEEFFLKVPPDILKPGTENDEHKVKLGRLKYELRCREVMESKYKKMESEKDQLENHISQLKTTLFNMGPLLANIVKSVNPIKDELIIPDIAVLQSMNSRNCTLDDWCISAVALESGPLTEEESLADLNRGKNCISKLKERAASIMKTGSAVPSKSLTKDITLDFSTVKTLLKRFKLRVYLAQKEVYSQRSKSNSLQSKLSALEYEINNIRHETEICMLETSPSLESIQLCPVEELFENAPLHISRPMITKHDAHELMRARLKWELHERRSLDKSLASREIVKKKLKSELDVVSNKFARLEVLISGVISAARPLSEQLANASSSLD